MSGDDKGFEVKDRRRFSQDGAARPSEEEPRKKPEPAEEMKRECGAGENPDTDDCVFPPVEFSSFMLSLAHAAVVHLGLAPDPDGNRHEANLPMARHTIDTIALLQKKTKGNLSEDEQRLLDNTLTELRLAYVQLKG